MDPLSSDLGWMPKGPLTVFHILFSSKKPSGPTKSQVEWTWWSYQYIKEYHTRRTYFYPSCTDGGIAIDWHRCSVYCYADDLLLASTSISGLQSLIDSANSCMIEHVLSFNTAKTTCLIHGKNPFPQRPQCK